ncbi:hypothetical protein BOX15_Mlig018009g2 [Macrostomum lignano]|uniref:FACT complex subunit SSRP1 n=1 Tax=Macrostomum lignano TaxID=282301 RepID=A0A267GH94_9PLAT|nr:hypothetical protein BOX15_Mlig018009g2 [Macrostomum lignano]
MAAAVASANGDQKLLEFDHIYQEIRGMMYPGKLRLRQADIYFKNEKTGRIDHFSSSDIEQVHWIIRARGFCLKFLLGDLIYRYDGFREADLDKLSAFARANWQVEIEKKDLAYKGWNWGQLNFVKNAMELEVSGHTAFELPLNNVANVSTGKQEVTLEFHQNDDAEVCLMEMRFHIGERSELQCEEVAKRVMDKADIIQLTGDALCEFKELYCVQPRGRYDFRFYPTFLHMHGKTFDYKIPISTIYRMFVLPHADGRQNFLVLGLEPPIKHGQTRYHFLILLFDVEIETSVELRCSKEELQAKYGGKLQKEMSGKEFEVISRLCRVLVNRKITVPGYFRSKSNNHYISCGYKANTGFLYPLDRGFIFVPKPPMHIRFEEISSVQFSRGTASVRSFDFEINTKAGVTYTFNSVEKDEYSHLYKFVEDKQLPVKNMGEEDTTGKLEAWESSEAESDGDDVYMKRVKAEGKERTAGSANTSGGGGGESDDDSRTKTFYRQRLPARKWKKNTTPTPIPRSSLPTPTTATRRRARKRSVA